MIGSLTIIMPPNTPDPDVEILEAYSSQLAILLLRKAASSLEYAHIADFILKHHEKWDGTGYPLRLKGEEVPKIVRIFSIVDYFVDEFIDCHEDYNHNKDRIIESIKSKAGFDFDPNLAEMFIKLLIIVDQN